MSKSVIILGVIIVAAIVMDAIIAACYNARLAKIGKKYTGWNAKIMTHTKKWAISLSTAFGSVRFTMITRTSHFKPKTLFCNC